MPYRCRITTAAPEDAAFVAANAREADRREFEASSGRTPSQVVAEAMATADMAFTGWRGGVPVCIFGVSPASLLIGRGTPWLVGTDHLDRCARPLLRVSMPALDLFHARYPELMNYVDARNDRAIRWLRWMGFTIHPAEPHGIAGLPFHKFERSRRDV